MASKWLETRLKAVTTLITKGTTPTTLGMPFASHGINFIKAESITDDGRIDRSKFAFVDIRTHETLRRSQIEADDLLMSMAGVYLGKVAVAPADIVPANTNQAVAIIRLDKRVADPRFVAYLLRRREFNIYINNLVAQSAQPNVNLSEIGSLPLRLPPIAEQRAIGNVLSALDDKIDANRKMNRTLSAMARALFKSWFLDFDPIRAKAEGRDRILPHSLTDMLPSSFEHSELGTIPKGWRASSVYDLAAYVNGAAYRAFEPNEERLGLPIIKIAELKAGVTAQTRFSAVDMPKRYRIDNGDILFSWSGNPDTSIDIFVWTNGPAWLNQHIFRVVPNSVHERPFVLMTLRTLLPIFAEIARNKQTTGLGHVTVEDLKRLLVVRPPESVLLRWNTLVEPMLARSFGLEEESTTLALLRDTLLPKLISGELRVKDAARVLGSAVI